MDTFLIFGYGIPKDILSDLNYNVYFRVLFNTILRICRQRKNDSPIIIFTGGITDMYAPYKRTEAEEMKRLFQNLMTANGAGKYTKKWRILTEKKALSTLENQIYCHRIMKKRGLDKGDVYIFCEQTRLKRIGTTAKIIFSHARRLKVIAIDFDTSAGRYLEPDFINRKEALGLKLDLEHLAKKTTLAEYRQFFVDKFKEIRAQKKARQFETLVKIWSRSLKK